MGPLKESMLKAEIQGEKGKNFRKKNADGKTL